MQSPPLLRPMSPKKVDRQLARLIQHLGLDASQVVLLKHHRPETFKPAFAHCHFNTWIQTRHAGGISQRGWILAQDKLHQFAESIFHTVWRTPDGRLVDVTPRLDGEKRVMFIPDPVRSIVLAEESGRAAIDTFDNVRFQGQVLLSDIQRIRVVMQDDFAERHGLFPWPTNGTAG